jgi:hypothetical protein
MNIEKDIMTNEGEDLFQLRLIKSEKIGLVTAKSGKSYLILDSADYWYDCIQDSYPRIKKCSCKNDWFKLKFNYYYREHYNDVKNIEVKCFCVNCKQESTVLAIDIKYSPTDHLVENPLIYCEKPKIKYNGKVISCILKLNELYEIINFLSELGFIIYCWYWDGEQRQFETLSMEKMQQVKNILTIYLTQDEINTDDVTLVTNELGIYLKENLWRKNEFVEIDGGVHLVGVGMSYMIRYSTQIIENTGEVKNKSKKFSEKIEKFEKWYNEKYGR